MYCHKTVLLYCHATVLPHRLVVSQLEGAWLRVVGAVHGLLAAQYGSTGSTADGAGGTTAGTGGTSGGLHEAACAAYAACDEAGETGRLGFKAMNWCFCVLVSEHDMAYGGI